MVRWLFLGLLILFYTGCSPKSTDLSLQEDRIQIYRTDIDNVILHEHKSREVLTRFPFISLQKGIQPKGRFPDEFYRGMEHLYKAQNIKDVDFWELEKRPRSLDFIYILPVSMNEYRDLSRDLFTNLCYSYNISKEEQEILKEWISQGGILWVESGVYSTKYDLFTRGGEIATAKISRRIKRNVAGKRFLNHPIRSYLFKSDNLDLVNYIPKELPFTIGSADPLFKRIKRLRLNLDNYLHHYFVIGGRPLIRDRKGRTLASITQYKNGFIVSLLPFEYSDAYYDGELFRWKLLYYVLKRK